MQVNKKYISDNNWFTKLDQPSWKNEQHQTPETRPQLQT
jgi:hypothetical protein